MIRLTDLPVGYRGFFDNQGQGSNYYNIWDTDQTLQGDGSWICHYRLQYRLWSELWREIVLDCGWR